jgi:hypothetical protein
MQFPRLPNGHDIASVFDTLVGLALHQQLIGAQALPDTASIAKSEDVSGS